MMLAQWSQARWAGVRPSATIWMSRAPLAPRARARFIGRFALGRSDPRLELGQQILDIRFEQLDAVAPGALGGVKRGVGAAEKRIEVAASARIPRHADADGRAHREAVDEGAGVGEGAPHGFAGL